MKQWKLFSALLLALIALLLFFVQFSVTPTVRGKFSGASNNQSAVSPQLRAAVEKIAFSSPLLQKEIANHRTASLGIISPGGQYLAEHPSCQGNRCQQLNLYDFETKMGMSAIVNTDSAELVELQKHPHNRPLLSRELTDTALQIALNAPEVIAELGFKPEKVSMAPNEGWFTGGGCEEGDICLAATFDRGDRNLWAIVNLTQQKLVGTFWTTLRSAVPSSSPMMQARSAEGCLTSGSVNKDGWSISHEMTASDGLNVFNVAFQNRPVLNSAKVVEWHASYPPKPGGGFIDSTGCSANFGFPIFPAGGVKLTDIVDQTTNDYLGFELVQSFYGLDWGQNCSYRYEQHFQFYLDGSFRIAAGAYGRGCGSGPESDPTYTGLVRIDLAENANYFERWNGQTWQPEPVELWVQETASMTESWRVVDSADQGYALTTDYGLYGGDSLTETAYVYVTRYQAEEGSLDFGAFETGGSCCYEDHRQGPQEFIDGDVIDKTRLVLWFAPQLQSNSAEGSYHCWTVQGEPNPITFPCFGGLRFRPIIPPPTAVTTTQTKSPPPNQWVVLGSVGLAVLILSGYIIGRSAINRKSEEQS